MVTNHGRVQSPQFCGMPQTPLIRTLASFPPLTTRFDATQNFIKVSWRAHIHVLICVDLRLCYGCVWSTELKKETVADLKDKQLEIIAQMNSWVFSRLIAENEKAGELLSHEMDAVAEAEREQGRSFSPHLVLSYLPRPWASGGTMALHESLRVRANISGCGPRSLRKCCFARDSY